ncbi:D-aminoacyl-tRNA deacylase 1 isoform 1-T5 [Spinachia spinachia]
MRAVIQRVTKATVTVGEEEISSIGRGLCVLLGVSMEDTQKDADYIVRKILNLRLFEDEGGRAWTKSVVDRDFEVLCVSQFTLQCVLKGNKPDFHSAMPAERAQPFYNSILEDMRSSYKPELIKGEYPSLPAAEGTPCFRQRPSPPSPAVSTAAAAAAAAAAAGGDGRFGAYMQVHIQNDGPVTIDLTSPMGPSDLRQLSKQERQQQRKEKTLSEGPSESSREKGAAPSRRDPDRDVSSDTKP